MSPPKQIKPTNCGMTFKFLILNLNKFEMRFKRSKEAPTTLISTVTHQPLILMLMIGREAIQLLQSPAPRETNGNSFRSRLAVARNHSAIELRSKINDFSKRVQKVHNDVAQVIMSYRHRLRAESVDKALKNTPLFPINEMYVVGSQSSVTQQNMDDYNLRGYRSLHGAMTRTSRRPRYAHL